MKKYKWNVQKFVVNMFLLFTTLLLFWFAVSWLDICIHNGLDDGEPRRWNLLMILVDNAVNARL